MKLSLITAASVSVLLTATQAQAAPNDIPNGKPFVVLDGQIIEVQGKLLTLEERLDNYIEINGGTIAGMLTSIDSLIEDIESLEAQVSDNTDGVDANLELIKENKVLIERLRAKVAALEKYNGFIESIKGKTCPDGQYYRGSNEIVETEDDGHGGTVELGISYTLACSPMPEPTEESTGVDVVYKWSYTGRRINPSSHVTTYVYCPTDGYTAIGGGIKAPNYISATGVPVPYPFGVPETHVREATAAWEITLFNHDEYTDDYGIIKYVTCIK